MPKLSDTMEEGTILDWLKPDGSQVRRGDLLAEISSDKASFEIGAERDGRLHIMAPKGSAHAIGAVIGQLLADGELPLETQAPPQGASPQPVPATPTETAAPSSQPTASAGPADQRRRVSPLAKKLAGEMGVDLESVTGSGPGGLVVREDVESAAAAPHATISVVPPSKMEQAIAKRMVTAKATVPHFYVGVEVDMAAALQALAHLRKAPSSLVTLTVTHLLIKACASAVAVHPRMNRSWQTSGLHNNPSINIGLAVALEDGLVAPVLHDADGMTLPEIVAETARMVHNAQAGTLRERDLQGASLTISNLGMFEVDDFTAIINVPEAAILAVGAVKERAVIKHGAAVASPTMRLNLSCDHRVIYGADAARFMQTLRSQLEQPETWT